MGNLFQLRVTLRVMVRMRVRMRVRMAVTKGAMPAGVLWVDALFPPHGLRPGLLHLVVGQRVGGLLVRADHRPHVEKKHK